jgi:hypothetical protein
MTKELTNNNIIINTINDKYKNIHNFYLYSKHSEQSKRDKILHIINNTETNNTETNNIDDMKEQIKSILFLKNHTYKVKCVSFKWIVHDNNDSFTVIFGQSIFYNNTGKEQINKNKIRTTSAKRLLNKPYVAHVFIGKHNKITYKHIYEWLKQNIKYYK